jgi:hypothetical protein
MGIKEIDFGWWNSEEKCLYLLELKDYTSVQASLEDREKSEKLIHTLWKKSLDVMIMLSAVWLNSEGSRDIKPCFQAGMNKECTIRIYHLINCDKTFEPHLLPLNTRLINCFKGYRRLFDNIRAFRIISARQAERIFRDRASDKPFIIKEEPAAV